MASTDPAQKFDPARAGEYQAQSRIALAGYDACHELAACMLVAVVGPGTDAHVLVVGAGGGAQEIVMAGGLEPAWHFTAVDPSQPMMDIAADQLALHGLSGRTETHLGYVDDLPDARRFDAATLIGVLHHLPGGAAKRHIGIAPVRWTPMTLLREVFAYAQVTSTLLT
jgi:tRNA (cmo5U34)-methyltransferase